MKIWTRIRNLNIKQFYKLSLLLAQHPLLIIPTLSATKRTFELCTSFYGNNHGKSNKGNAFRHSLWNALICKQSLKRTKNKQKSVFWAQKVTDLYERVTQNNLLDEQMDLQNNAVGRLYFLNFVEKAESEMVHFIWNKSKVAEKIIKTEDIKSYPSNMVYIVD
ncbi:hypothetical protein MWU65_01750 [Cellulophaga sp. F20128]|uniref:DUF6973 domain-containing protein n=1 Tax=Cellulophaga sp. F20128 TaxID=2926413 RepID=UPI001FF42B17|nr:hypothetical protein [Cellulophaga sp. F20128]MCK0155883.1 hypothetical protein [Cellulophaga sp. F20128]